MSVRSASVVFVFLSLLLASSAAAFETPAPQTELQEKQFFKDDLRISTEHVRLDAPALRERVGDAVFERFDREHGSSFQFYMDPRSGALTSMIGRIPLIPGPGVGNDTTLDDVAAALGRPVARVDSPVVAGLARLFVNEQAKLIGLDTDQLGTTRAVQVNDQVWQISMPQVVDGIPVRHGRLAATISHGNLVLLGVETWGNVELDTEPRITAEQALAIGFVFANGRRADDELWQKPTLEIVPYAPPQHQTGDAFTGPVGSGYGHRLVWAFGFRRGAELPRWELLVDAHDGEVVSLEDTNHYAEEQMTGGVYPLTSTEICPDNDTCGEMQSGYPMPFADTGLAPPNDLTNSAGMYDYTEGTVSTQLNGPYVRVLDVCGPIAESSEGSLDLGGVNGDHDCVSSGASPGDTPASRACFYELNKLMEMARGWLPGNAWLQSQLTANVNINNTCNANYDYTDVNFFKSGGGCRNTGEIAAVFDHEWGHAMDDNDSGGSMSVSSEAYADIASIFRLQASCVGHGFWHTNDRGCGMTSDGTGFNANEARTGVHCDLDCSGVRDADWDKHADHTPDTPQNFSCISCSSGGGPCGAQVHCDAAPTRQAAWDLVARELVGPPFNYDSNTAFVIGNRLFYQGSGNVGAWHACSCPSSSSGCGASNGYMQWLALDDDNGDLADGTPHMTALHAAFARHNIACDTPAPVNSGCPAGPNGAPALTLSIGSNRLGLEWNAVPGASSYRVLRTEGHAGCDLGKALIAEVSGLSYDDNEVANDREYSYVVQAVGASPSCFSPTSTCETGTPQPCAGSVVLDRGLYNCSDTVTISLTDSDLVGLGSYQVGASSTTESTPESVIVVESPIDSGQFIGTLVTTGSSPVHGDGMLSVANGDTITITYQDTSFCGIPNVIVNKTALVDCVAPVIANVQADQITGSSAEITWQTNEIADSRVVYDVLTPPSSASASDPQTVHSHLVELTGLGECTPYYFYVESTDPAANTVADTNDGEYYTFETGRNVNPTYPTLDPVLPIPDNNPTGVESTVVVSDDNVIEDVEVTVNITHTYDSELRLSLIGPDGTTVVLADHRGGSGNDFVETVFDDEAATPISDGDPPFTGSFIPDQPLSAFDGKLAAGTWKLRVVDDASGDTGSIQSWSLTLAYPQQSCGPHLSYHSHSPGDDCASVFGGGGGGNGIVEPGEDIVLPVMLRNDGTDPTTGISARLTTSTPGVTVTQALGDYPDLMPGESAVGIAAPYAITVNRSVFCGTTIQLQLEMACNEGSWTDNFGILVGTPAVDIATHDSDDLPQDINSNMTITSDLVIADNATVTDVDVGLTLTHTYTGDLDIFLVGPDGTRVELSTDNGGSGNNFTDTIFDDEAATSITNGNPPYTGSFRPEGSLATLDGDPAAGTWTLEITDDASGDTGELLAWSLILTTESAPQCLLCMVTAPGAVHDLLWMPGTTTGLEWTPTPRATFYNVYRGIGSDLEYLMDFNPDSCHEITTNVPTTGEVLLDTPAPGSMYWYLVRAGSAGGEGSASNATAGPRMQNSSGPCH